MDKVILGGYVKIKTGKLDANASEENGKYPFFTCAREISRINTYAFDCECVLVAGNGELNVKYYEGKFNAYQRTYVIESIDHQVLSTKYLYYFIDSYMEKLRNGAIGGVIKYIKLSHLTDIELPLPDLETQDKIVAILDKAKSLIDKREKTIQKFDELLRATFWEMFGNPVKNEKEWDKIKLSELGTFKNGMNFSREETGFKLRCLGVSDFKKLSRFSDFNSLPFINLNKKPSQDFLLKNGDIVFVRSNGSKELVGRSLEIAVINEDVTYSGFCIRFRNESKFINTTYLNHLFRSPLFKSKMLEGGRGANIQNINQDLLGQLEIPLPNINLQNRFSEIVIKIEKNIEKLIQSKILLENLINGLSQSAFNGDLEFNTAVDLEVLLENDYEYFKDNADKKAIQLLLDRLDKNELNENKFYEKHLYDKAKSFVFELLKEEKIKQVYEKKQLKLVVI
uniref:restriction endonuclease subunit S n=1 Tax=Flavobacterium sp. TaxID=239 RepID=UPI00404A597F